MHFHRILFTALTVFSCSLPGFADRIKHTSAIPFEELWNKAEITEAKMAAFRLLVDPDLIEAFISLPETVQYFSEQIKGSREYFSEIFVPLVAHSLWLETDFFQNIEEDDEDDNEEPSVFDHFLLGEPLKETVLLPFVVWGAMDPETVPDPKLRLAVRKFGIRLFKDFLDREWYEFSRDRSLLPELRDFAEGAPAPLFSDSLATFVDYLMKDCRFDETASLYSQRKEPPPRLSDAAALELERIYRPSDPALFQSFEESIRALPERVPEELYELDEEDEEGIEMFRDLEEDYDRQNFFSKAKIFNLFLDAAAKRYPEREDVMEFIRKRGAFVD